MNPKATQRAKLALKALLNLLTKDVKDDYYLIVKTQKSLSLSDLAQEVAAGHGHQNAAEAEMLAREILELAAWYLAAGYTVTTPLGYFRTTVSGTLLESELTSAPDRSRLKKGKRIIKAACVCVYLSLPKHVLYNLYTT